MAGVTMQDYREECGLTKEEARGLAMAELILIKKFPQFHCVGKELSHGLVAVDDGGDAIPELQVVHLLEAGFIFGHIFFGWRAVVAGLMSF